MNAVIFAYSRQGCNTARRIEAFFAGAELRRFTMARFDQPDFGEIPRPSRAFYGEQFAWADAMVFVGSCGIAVREIAPHVKDKRTDPAVIVVDELAAFVIPLLSGHIGGANELARGLAENLGAVPVVTTATDINRRFSVDAWAARKGYVIGNIAAVKDVSAAILEGDVAFTSDFPVVSEYPCGVRPNARGDVGIYVGYYKKSPYARTLHVIPRVLHVGIGCRRGIAREAITDAVRTVLAQNGLDERAVRGAASIDIKQDEEGLIAACLDRKWQLSFYSAQQLSEVEGEFTSSSFVKSVTGVDNVCERAALRDAARLLVRKTAIDGVTVAVAAEDMEVSFE